MLYQELLDKITDKCKEIFKSNLTGVYLHGSLAMGCFNKAKSDIDFIVVIENDITDRQKMEFMQAIVEFNNSAPAKGIEMSVVKKEYCNNFVYPTPYELHFSNSHIEWFNKNPEDYINKMKGTDKDLAAHFTIIKKYGITLYGEAVDSVFENVPASAYMDSIRYDVEGAREDILENPVYVILNLCRVVAFIKDNLITSKKQGGEWGISNLSPEYKELIEAALESYASDKDMVMDWELADRFAEEMVRVVK